MWGREHGLIFFSDEPLVERDNFSEFCERPFRQACAFLILRGKQIIGRRNSFRDLRNDGGQNDVEILVI
jgi:hypothetical protein